MKTTNRAISLIALLLALMTLFSACSASYTLLLPGGSGGNGGGLGGLGGIGGGQGGADTQFPKDHLFFSKELSKNLVGFSVNKQYFAANFNMDLSVYAGRGAYLFEKEEDLSDQERQEISKELSNKNKEGVLARLKEGENTFEYVVYALESAPNMKRLAVKDTHNPLTAQIYVYRYLENEPEDLMGYFENLIPEPVKFSSAFAEWLLTDQTTYPASKNFILEDTMLQGEKNSFGGFVNAVIRPSITDYALRARLPRAVCDASENVGTEQYAYRWWIYYRVKESGEHFKCLQVNPFQHKYALPTGDRLYFIDLLSAGMVPKLTNGNSTDYEMVLIISNLEGDILCWNSDIARWSKAVALMIPTAHDPFFPIWLSESGAQEANTLYTDVSSEVQVLNSPAVGGATPSPFYALQIENNGAVQAALAFNFSKTNGADALVKSVFVREKGSTLYTEMKGTLVRDGANYTFFLSPDSDLSLFHLKSYNEFNSYEFLLIYQNPVGSQNTYEWFKKELAFTNQSEAAKEAVLKANSQNP